MSGMRPAGRAGSLAAALLLAGAVSAHAAAPARAEPAHALARSIFKQLVDIDTTDAHGNVSTAAQAVAQRLLEAGFPAQDVRVEGPSERKRNLVARLRGRAGGDKPVLLLGHLDVVEARREDWSTDPFTLIEKDGYFQGRGALDMKDGAAVMVAAMIRLKQSGQLPARDIVLALTADEEGGHDNGVHWLLQNRRAELDAEYVINLDSWTVWSAAGPAPLAEVDLTEKVYGDYELLVTSPGGHSSEPAGANAIDQLVGGLARLGTRPFPFELNAVTRAYYETAAGLVPDDLAATYRGILRTPPDPQALAALHRVPQAWANTHTTCVPTRLAAGHANNALPQRASANVNCRILPGHSQEEIRAELARIVADPGISVAFVADDGTITPHAPDRRGYAPAKLEQRILDPMGRALQQAWPGRTLVPAMANGASDAIYTMPAGLPTYTLGVIVVTPQEARAHGRDERIPVADFDRYDTFFDHLLRAVAR